MPEHQDQEQRVLALRYRLIEKLGSGGFGTIWRAHHLVLEAPVAVKLIAAEVAEDVNAVERFLREAKAAAALRSPHVVQILDYGVDDGTPFMVMELLEGETLAQRVRRRGPLSTESTVRFITHVCRAMARAHAAGIVHRDLKPENVFIIENEGDELAKVLDFGVAKLDSSLTAASSRTRTGSLLGTPYYMSPEQVQGTKEVDHRSDLWSIGVIAFECLTGKKPFVSDGLGELVLQICVRPMPVPSQIATQLPGEFDAWFKQALERDPERRFQSAAALAAALRESLGVEARDTLIATGDDELPSVTNLASAPTEPPPADAVYPRSQPQEPEIPTVNIGKIVRDELARSEASERSSATVWVALVALILGMVGGGVYLYAWPLDVRLDPARPLPAPVPVTKKVEAVGRKVEVPDASRSQLDAGAPRGSRNESADSTALRGRDIPARSPVLENDSVDAAADIVEQDAGLPQPSIAAGPSDSFAAPSLDGGGAARPSESPLAPSDAGALTQPPNRRWDARVE